jgi:hypothetical protein
MEDKKLEDLLQALGFATDGLKNAAEIATIEIKAVLAGIKELPPDCQSRASMSELILRRVEKNLADANGTYERLLNYIWENYNHK